MIRPSHDKKQGQQPAENDQNHESWGWCLSIAEDGDEIAT